MDSQIYQEMMKIENKHWWFVARRSILDKVIESLSLPESAEILEAGCGTGGNLAMLKRHGKVCAMELNETARAFANNLNLAPVKSGCLPDHIPFADQQFDLIVLLDVLEHLEEDTSSLQTLSAKLKPSGWLLVTVPAFPWMWTKQDQLLHHKRRYVQSNLRQVVNSAGYNIKLTSYFNFFLFPVIAGIRLLLSLLNKEVNETGMPPQPINQMLTLLFSWERYFINRLSFPFGVSLLLLAQRNELTNISS